MEVPCDDYDDYNDDVDDCLGYFDCSDDTALLACS